MSLRSVSTRFLPWLGLASVLACLTGAAGADSQNVIQRANVNNYSFHNDVWGYNSPGGVELAIVGTFNGTSFVDVTDPDNPVEVGFIAGPGSTWRDIKTYGTYAYIVNEEMGGMDIVDLSDPLNPVETVTSPYQGAFSTSHNIYIDVANALLYAVGTNNGTQVLDISNPENPVIAGSFNQNYVHDIYVEDGIGYAALIFDQVLATLDVSNVAGGIPILDTIGTPSLACHNTWLTEDNQYCLTTDETGGGHIGVYDVSDPSNISYVSEWENPDETSSSAHNATVRGDFAYISWYTSGLEILSLADPHNPDRVGYYDTHPGTTGYDGAWGVYPFADSGLIYISDMSTGLYIFEFVADFGYLEGYVTDADTGDPIPGATVTVPSALTEIQGTTDATGYYRLIVSPGSYDVVYTAFGYGEVVRNVEIVQGDTTREDVGMLLLPTGALAGTVTEFGSGDPLEGAVIAIESTPLSTVTDQNGDYAFPTVPIDTYTANADLFGYERGTESVVINEGEQTVQDFQLAAACFADDLESDQGWTVGAIDDDATTGIWVRVDPNGTGGGAVQPEDDHTADPGVLCFVTGQGPPGGGIGDNDVDNGKTTLFTPVYDLSGATGATFVGYRWYSNDAGSNPGTDIFLIDVSSNGGFTWSNLETLGDTKNFWERVEFDLTPYISGQVQLRFVASDESPGSIVEAGIDDAQIFCDTSADAPGPPAVAVTRLFNAAPNPAAGPTTLRFQLATRAPVKLQIVDLQGRVVRTLVSGVLEAGSHDFVWDRENSSGHPIAGGVYLQRLVTPGGYQSRKVVVAD